MGEAAFERVLEATRVELELGLELQLVLGQVEPEVFLGRVELELVLPSPCPRPFRARRQALNMWCTWEMYTHDCGGLRVHCDRCMRREESRIHI